MSKTAASYPQTGRAQTLRLVKMSSMVAISIVLVYLIHFPIFRQWRFWSTIRRIFRF